MSGQTDMPRLSVCVSFDWDTMSVWPTAFRLGARRQLSRGEVGAMAVPRLLEILRRQEALGTFFVPGFTALAFPDIVRAVRDAGHEIGHHGWMHEDASTLPPEAQERSIRRGLQALDAVLGVTPVGYRCPGAELGSVTARALQRSGIRYEATCSAGDFYPWYLRHRDSWDGTGAYELGAPSPLIAMPFSWTLTDFAQFEHVPGWTTTTHTPSMVAENWRSEFDYAYAHAPGGAFVLCMHPQAIGKGSRLEMLEALLAHMRGRPGVRFEPMRDYVERWRAANPPAPETVGYDAD